MPDENATSNPQEAQRLQDLRITSRVLTAALLVGCMCVWLRFAVTTLFSGAAPKAWTATGQTFTALLWAAAWFAAAFVFGFLFGIPKALQSPSKAAPSGTSEATRTNSETNTKDASHLRVNTNLEEISDWLTKILVGATLTQLIKIPGAIKNAADFMANSAGGIGSTPFAAALLLYFSAVGFFAGYVLTRMFFSLAFSRFDSSLGGFFGRVLSGQQVDSIAGQLINPNADPETKEDGYNSIIYRSLYLPAPTGFEKAIQYGNEFLQSGKPSRASIYINLACAYGQQYRYLKQNKASAEDLGKTRAAALDAVKQALQISPGSKSRFRELLHPKPGEQDNDLQPFETDEEFKNLIDKP